MRLKQFCLLIIFSLFSVSGYAEYYKYVDKDGNVHFTDDLTKIPEKERNDAKEYTEIESRTNAGEDKVKEPEDEDSDISGEESEDAEKVFNIKRENLKNEYEALQQELKQLKKEKKKFRKKAQAKAYNEKVEKLNKKIGNYENNQEILKDKIEKYNEELKQKTLEEKQKQ